MKSMTGCCMLLVLSLFWARTVAFKIFVAELPLGMHTPTDWHLSEDPVPLIGKTISQSDSLYASEWQHMDRWWIYQMLRSPLRVDNAKDADMVFIPMSFTLIHGRTEQLLNTSYILGNGTKYFPYLHEKPHVLVINHPQSQANYGATFQHDLRHLYHVVTIAADFGIYRHMNTTIAPHFWRIHWQSSSKEFHEVYDEAAIVKEKTHLVTGCWMHRDKRTEDTFYVSRKVWREQCLNHTDLCKWVKWTVPHTYNNERFEKMVMNMSLVVKKAIDSSWYTIIPIGDYHTRGSIFDMLLSNSIGVIEHRVEVSLPFLDVIDYHQFVKFVEPGGLIVEELKSQFNETEAREMIKKKFPLKHLFQYSLEPKHQLVTAANRHVIHPDDDAFTFTLKTMLRRWCREGFYKTLRC